MKEVEIHLMELRNLINIRHRDEIEYKSTVMKQEKPLGTVRDGGETDFGSDPLIHLKND